MHTKTIIGICAILLTSIVAQAQNSSALEREPQEWAHNGNAAAARCGVLPSVDSLLEELCANNLLPQIVALVEQHGQVVHLSAHGFSDAARERQCATDDIFALHRKQKPLLFVRL